MWPAELLDLHCIAVLFKYIKPICNANWLREVTKYEYFFLVICKWFPEIV